MLHPTIQPAADPLDEIERRAVSADSAQARQERTDPPGRRPDEPDAESGSDKYIDATRAVSEGSPDTDSAVLEDHEGSRTVLGSDVEPAVDESEEAGNESLR